MKSIALLAGLALAVVAFDVQAQPAILKSPSVAGAKACLDRLAEDSRKAGYQTDREGGQILILHPTRQPLYPLLLSMSKCLSAAYPKKEVVKHPNTGTSSRIWWVYADGYYAWCATNSTEDRLDYIELLGGRGPQRDWYGLTFSCEIAEKILGFYKP